MASAPQFELYKLQEDLSRDELVDTLARTPARLRAIVA
jgi:hypothetical protein